MMMWLVIVDLKIIQYILMKLTRWWLRFECE